MHHGSPPKHVSDPPGCDRRASPTVVPQMTANLGREGSMGSTGSTPQPADQDGLPMSAHTSSGALGGIRTHAHGSGGRCSIP
jgi:hypothetical protein